MTPLSDDEAEIIVVEAGFGVEESGADEFDAGFVVNMLVEFAVEFGEKRIEGVNPSLGAKGFLSDVSGLLVDVEVVTGTGWLEDWVLATWPNRFEDV